MAWYCVLMTAVAVISIIILLLYRRQVKIICRHLAFIRDKNSNMAVTAEIYFREIKELTDKINGLIDTQKKIESLYTKNDEYLKTTITNLSHDIRTPLTSLDGYFQLLADSENQQEKEKYIGIIQNRIDSLTDMLEELFTYAKLQDSGYKVELESVNVSKLVLDTAFSFVDSFASAGTEPEIDIVQVPVYIKGNQTALKRVFQNILKNALLHGGEDVVIKLQDDYQDNKVMVSISNSYMSGEEIDTNLIFTRFYKADKSRGAKNSTGLGLYIAKELVEVMGGEIKADVSGGIFTVRILFDKSK